MEFDKSRVYTALNADKLEVGSTIFVADTLAYLKETVNSERSDRRVKLDNIASECCDSRFHADNESWLLAYLISPPKKPKYKPFSDTETAFKIIAAHGARVRDNFYPYVLITGIKRDTDDDGNYEISLQIFDSWHSAKTVVEGVLFADDGSPVGEKIEDSDTEEDGAT